jgi:hypothetical protein
MHAESIYYLRVKTLVTEVINSVGETPRKYIPPSAFEQGPPNRFQNLLRILSST